MNSYTMSDQQSLLFSWRLRILSSTIKVYDEAAHPADVNTFRKLSR
jgi:hypothetical protein